MTLCPALLGPLEAEYTSGLVQHLMGDQLVLVEVLKGYWGMLIPQDRWVGWGLCAVEVLTLSDERLNRGPESHVVIKDLNLTCVSTRPPPGLLVVGIICVITL